MFKIFGKKLSRAHTADNVPKYRANGTRVGTLVLGFMQYCYNRVKWNGNYNILLTCTSAQVQLLPGEYY